MARSQTLAQARRARRRLMELKIALIQCVIYVLTDIIDIFDADRDPEQAFGDAGLGSFFGGEGGVGH